MKRALLHVAVGGSLLLLVLVRVDLTEVLASARRIDPEVLVATVMLLAGSHILKGVRWQAILRAQGLRYPLVAAVRMYWSGLFIGVVTPGRLGDLVRVVYLKQDGVRSGRGLAGVAIDRLLDIGVLLLALGYGLVSTVVWGQAASSAAAGLGWPLPAPVWQWLAGRLAPSRLRVAAADGWDDFAAGFAAFLRARADLVWTGALTVANWAIYLGIVWMLVRAMGLDLAPGLTLLLYSVAALASFVPFSVAGIGTRDAALALLAKVLGLDLEVAVTFSFAILLLHVLTALVGVVGWNRGRRLADRAVGERRA